MPTDMQELWGRIHLESEKNMSLDSSAIKNELSKHHPTSSTTQACPPLAFQYPAFPGSRFAAQAATNPQWAGEAPLCPQTPCSFLSHLADEWKLKIRGSFLTNATQKQYFVFEDQNELNSKIAFNLPVRSLNLRGIKWKDCAAYLKLWNFHQCHWGWDWSGLGQKKGSSNEAAVWIHIWSSQSWVLRLFLVGSPLFSKTYSWPKNIEECKIHRLVRKNLPQSLEINHGPIPLDWGPSNPKALSLKEIFMLIINKLSSVSSISTCTATSSAGHNAGAWTTTKNAKQYIFPFRILTCEHPHFRDLAFLSHRSEQSQQSSTLKVYKWKKFKTSIVRSTALQNSYPFNQGNVQFSLQLLPFKTFDFVRMEILCWVPAAMDFSRNLKNRSMQEMGWSSSSICNNHNMA